MSPADPISGGNVGTEHDPEHDDQPTPMWFAALERYSRQIALLATALGACPYFWS